MEICLKMRLSVSHIHEKTTLGKTNVIDIPKTGKPFNYLCYKER
jgi:hypothetical protein